MSNFDTGALVEPHRGVPFPAKICALLRVSGREHRTQWHHCLFSSVTLALVSLFWKMTPSPSGAFLFHFFMSMARLPVGG